MPETHTIISPATHAIPVVGTLRRLYNNYRPRDLSLIDNTQTILTVVASVADAIPVAGPPLKASIAVLLNVLNIITVSRLC